MSAGDADRGPAGRPVTVALLALWALVATGVAVWQALSWPASEPAGEPADVGVEEPPPDQRVLVVASYADLPGWGEDDLGEAMAAWLRSCTRFRFLGPSAKLAPVEVGGTVADWLPVCERVTALRGASASALRAFFEAEMVPLAVLNGDREIGLFTGYYEPLLTGSRKRSARYAVPLYALPNDLVSVDLGQFRPDLAGRRIAGRLAGSTLEPYSDRAQIEAGALASRALELLWVDDPIAAFFLQIQGSGQIELVEGGRMRVGYAGQNGHPYFAIGRELVRREAMTVEEVSLQSIRAWLEANPDQAAEVMATNASYVFFREVQGEGPLGSQGVALTPGRSLAVDRKFLPLGVPLWLEATAPAADGVTAPRSVRRLMVAQDTGGAISGPVRGDVFWGAGKEAEEVAGRMRNEGRYWLLVPGSLLERVTEKVIGTEGPGIPTKADAR